MMKIKYLPLSLTILRSVILPPVASFQPPVVIHPVNLCPLLHPSSSFLGLTLPTNTNQQHDSFKSSTVLFASASDESGTNVDSNGSIGTGKLDWDAMVKYVGSLVIQMSLLTGVLASLDKLVAVAGLDKQVPFAINFVLFYFLALKSRIFNPLCNARPTLATKEIANNSQSQQKQQQQQKRIMPSWTPPGFVFPIVWLLLIGPLRAATTAMIYAATGSYACAPILALMLHLSVGDVWNTINNVERRYGTSVLGIVGVYASAAFAAQSYSQVVPLAGKLLALKLIWLTVASSLIFRTWQLNPNPETGKPYSLLPRMEGDAKTEFMWF